MKTQNYTFLQTNCSFCMLKYDIWTICWGTTKIKTNTPNITITLMDSWNDFNPIYHVYINSIYFTISLTVIVIFECQKSLILKNCLQNTQKWHGKNNSQYRFKLVLSGLKIFIESSDFRFQQITFLSKQITIFLDLPLLLPYLRLATVFPQWIWWYIVFKNKTETIL